MVRRRRRPRDRANEANTEDRRKTEGESVGKVRGGGRHAEAVRDACKRENEDATECEPAETRRMKVWRKGEAQHALRDARTSVLRRPPRCVAHPNHVTFAGEVQTRFTTWPAAPTRCEITAEQRAPPCVR